MHTEQKFENDNFTSRRTTGHNMFDPESLISGAEASQGMTYDNSRREWPSEDIELDAIEGRITTDEVLRVAPRKFKPIEFSEFDNATFNDKYERYGAD